jgi:hypothetical protein
MPSLNVLIQTGAVCQCLREKKMFYDSLEDAAASTSEGPYWCAQTQSLLGPDGQIVTSESCRPGRACCETA